MLYQIKCRDSREELSKKTLLQDVKKLVAAMNADLPEYLPNSLNLLPTQHYIVPNILFYELQDQGFLLYYPIDVEEIMLSNAIADLILDKLNELNLTDKYSKPNTLAQDLSHYIEISTRHQILLKQIMQSDVEVNIKAIPEIYFCSLTGQLMDHPIKLPGGQFVEKKAIERHLANFATDPFDKNTELDLSKLEVDITLAQTIRYFIFEQASFGLAEKINCHLPRETKHKAGYQSFFANPYGTSTQLLDVPSSYTAFETGCTTTTSQYNQIISAYHRDYKVKLRNYPHPTKTRRALMDQFVAIISHDSEAQQNIIKNYPYEARQAFYAMQERLNIRNSFEKTALPIQRPFDIEQSFFLEPHFEETTKIQPVFQI